MTQDTKLSGIDKARKALAMEQAGASMAEIISTCGYKTPQSWYTSKNYYKKQLLEESEPVTAVPTMDSKAAADIALASMAKMKAAAEEAERRQLLREVLNVRHRNNFNQGKPAASPAPTISPVLAPVQAPASEPEVAPGVQKDTAPAAPALDISFELTARGKDFLYKYWGGVMTVSVPGTDYQLVLSPEEWEQMKLEVDHVLARAREVGA